MPGNDRSGDRFIDVQTVAKVYDTGRSKVEAIHHASFEVAKGEFVAILGPSGCGKSTLADDGGRAGDVTSRPDRIAGGSR